MALLEMNYRKPCNHFKRHFLFQGADGWQRQHTPRTKSSNRMTRKECSHKDRVFCHKTHPPASHHAR